MSNLHSTVQIFHYFIKYFPFLIFSNQLRVRAYDTGAFYLSSEAEVFITVRRNLNRPIFNPARYTVEIREDIAVESFIQKLTVSDPDGVSAQLTAETDIIIGI